MKNFLFLLVFCLFLIGCGESKEDKNSRQSLEVQVRQINTSFKNLKDNRKAEESITRISLGSFYSDYASSLTNVRNDLSKLMVTDKFAITRKSLDTLISKSIELINFRRDLMSGAFEVSSNISDFKRNYENALDYKYESYGYRYYLKYKKETLENVLSFLVNNRSYHKGLASYDSTSNALCEYCSVINSKLKENNFVDTLEFQNSLIDSTEIMYSIVNSFDSVELNTDNL